MRQAMIGEFLQTNIWLVLATILSGVMLFWSFFGNRIRGVKQVDTVGALQLINHKSALLLDVRDEAEFQGGHVKGAKNIPLLKLKDRIGELERYRDKPIVAICASGNRSATATAVLGNRQFGQVYSLTGGMMAWRKAELPVEK
jgi:rhodanese-related sulfurtransferase